jgi:hypothetical protein
MSIKQDAINVISSLPENTKIEEIMYRLYVLDKINQGQEAIKNGKKQTVDELKKEIETW